MFRLIFFAFAIAVFGNLQSSNQPVEISYGGMAIECPWGCGDLFEGDVHMEEIASTLGTTLGQVFHKKFPLCLDWQSLPWSMRYARSAWDWDDLEEDGECEVYNWQETKGLYVSEQPTETFSIETYPQFLDLASALRRDVRFYHLDVYRQELSLYKSVLPRLQQELDQNRFETVAFDENGNLVFDEWAEDTIPNFMRSLKGKIRNLTKDLTSFQLDTYEEKQEQIEIAIQKIDSLYREIFRWCLENHQPEGISFHAALEDFLRGDFELAIDQIRFLIEISEKHGLKDELLAKLYFLKGEILSEFGLYADAIIDLTHAIQKDPGKKEVYFERSVAYFELGRFDLALEDYLSSGPRYKGIQNPTQLGFGISSGLLTGMEESAVDFIPSTLTTLHGLGNGLWAFAKNPISASQELVDAAVKCVEYIKSHASLEILEEMVPEIKRLVKHYDNLKDYEKGQLIGHAIGKYGVDIFLGKQGAKCIKAYRDLKKANQAMTLQALVSPETAQTILTEAGKRWASREKVLKNGNLKINLAKQGKHLEGHPNYKVLLEQGASPSIFIHQDPQRLIQEYAGTGIKYGSGFPGMAGYREIVDFGEFIGYSIIPRTGEKIPTTMGKIHYAKDGLHIVPYIAK